MFFLFDKDRALSVLYEMYQDGGPIAIDTETNGEDIRDGRGFAQGVSVAWKRGEEDYSRIYLPFRHKQGFNYDKEVLEALEMTIENAEILVFHNAKFDLESLRTLGINHDKNNWYCTMVLASLINENRPYAKSLESCAKHYLGPEFGKAMDPILESFTKSFGWGEVPSEMMNDYAEMDAELPLRLLEVMWPLMEQEVPEEVWDYKRRFINTVRAMERRGVRIDREYVEKQAKTARIHMDDYRDMLDDYNPQSSKAMNELLCEQLGLPKIMREKRKKDKETGKWVNYHAQTFDREAMEEYEIMLDRLNSPKAEYILAYRGWSKAASAFYEAYLTHVSPDGRVRPTYHHHKDTEGGTVTGRLSCSNPNLQQIPKESKKPWNGGVKRSFIGQDGYSLWEFDYEQLELRLGTAYAGEESLMQVFNEDRDIFDEMAEELGFPRQQTKTFVYMTQYGAGTPKISRVMGVPETDAILLKDTYYSTYPGFRRINELVKKGVYARKKVKLWSGRYRHFVNAKDDAHKAFNSLIQGGSADIVERCMVHIFEQIDQQSNDEVRMLLTVHDSVWFEIKNGTEDKWLPEIERVMSDVGSLGDFGGVKFAVDAKKLSD